ncbi:MAG: ATP-grasp domain-containing protein [Ruminococcus flavefaciens]|nr:ATP-grasp domain-containing protein [Ruminococcus flavefaciens]
MEKKKILFLSSSPGTCEMIQYAQKLGLYTIVADWFDLSHSTAKRMADAHWEISFMDIDILEEKCRMEGVGAVLAATSEPATEAVIELCNRLSLPCFASKECFHYEKDKAYFKEICKKNGVPVPEAVILENGYDETLADSLNFPIVVKAVDCTSGRGITYCENKEEVKRAYEKARSVSNSPKVIIEKKIDGMVYTAVYAFASGEASLLYLNSEIKSNENQPDMSSCGSTVTPYVDEFVRQVNDNIIHALQECGCRDNVAWVEVIRDSDGRFYVIEMAHRWPGDLTAVEYSKIGRLDLVRWNIECALGIKHSKEDLPAGLERQMERFVLYEMVCCNKGGTVKAVLGREELMAHNIDILVDICPGDVLVVDKKTIGNIAFCADTVSEVCDKIEFINAVFKILDENDENMVNMYLSKERFMKAEFQ